MRQWEYLHVRDNGSLGVIVDDGNGEIQIEDSLIRAFNELGTQGWELTTSQYLFSYHIFRRQREG